MSKEEISFLERLVGLATLRFPETFTDYYLFLGHSDNLDRQQFVA